MASTTPMTDEQKDQAISLADSLSQAATTIDSNTFVFVANFDGTYNDKSDPAFSGDTQITAIGAINDSLYDFRQSHSDSNVSTNYYPGVGTDGTLPLSELYPTKEAIVTASRAYDDFAQQAYIWRESNPDGDIATVINSFSRGSVAGSIFAQMVYKDGLVYTDSNGNKTMLIYPGEINIAGGLSISPVTTGADGNLVYPSGANITVVLAENEYRTLYTQSTYGESSIQIAYLLGNHGNSAGVYEGNLDALNLSAEYSYMSILLGTSLQVPDDRTISDAKEWLIYQEDPALYAPQNLLTNDSFITRVEGISLTPTALGDLTVENLIDFAGNRIVITKLDGTTISEVVIPNGESEGAVMYLQSSADIKVNTDGSVQTNSYDSNGNLTSSIVMQLNGNQIYYSYDHDSLETTTYIYKNSNGFLEQDIYDSNNIIISRTEDFGNGFLSSSNYNNLGEIIKQDFYALTIDGILVQKSLEYDNDGNLTAMHEYHYDQNNNFIEVVTMYDIQDTFFFNQNGDLLGNIANFDPENALSSFDSLSSDSDLLEFFQTQMAINFIDTAGIYSSAFNRDPSEFDEYSVYSLDNKYYDTWNFSIDNIDELPQVQYDPNTMTITPETYNPTPNYTANNNLFSSLYVSYNDGSVGVNTTFQPYENWASVNGISIGASFGGDGYSFHVGFSWSFPVVLDLDGDGVELTSVLDSKAWFDIKGDGALHQTGWVGADDGLLAFDENGDGLITTGREIAFADRTIANDTDLEALRSEFDSNNNGILDENDADFDKFRIWQDKNSDGISDDGELFTLNEMGIKSINLISMDVGSYMVDGNKVNAFTTFTRTDDSVGIGGDVALAYDNAGYTTTIQNGYMTIKQTGSDAIYAMATGSSPLIINLANNNLSGAFGNDGNDTLDASGKTTTAILEGGSGDDTINGGKGDDWLDGGEGKDAMHGGDGNDTIVMDDVDDLSQVRGGNGVDTIIYQGSTNLTLNMNTLEVEAVYLGVGNDIVSDSDYSDIIASGGGNDTIHGTFGNDIYIFNRGDGVDTISDYVTGKTSMPVFMAGGGTMWVEVTTYNNTGEDTILFGDGISIYNLQIKNVNTDTEITIDSNDKIIIKNVTKEQKIENITFADGSTYKLQGLIIGTQGNDNLVGDDNVNNIEGDAGADTMSGGGGDDTYCVDNAGDIVTEGANKGIDTVRSSITYTLGVNVENLILTGTSDINGTGNAFGNILTGNSASNILNGAAGDDIIDGGQGADTMQGGVGNDTYIIDDVEDIVIENDSEGTDIINSSVTYTLSANVENLTFTGNSAINGTGNTLNNTILGNTANNILDGNEGADTLKGGDGNDTIYGGDGNDLAYGENGNDILSGGSGNDTLNGGTGIDTVSYEYSNVGVTVNLALTSTQTIYGTKKDTLTGIENLTGSNYNDTLKGSTLVNIINGLDGDDIIISGTGKTNDIFDGGAGTDNISYAQSTAAVTIDLSNTSSQNTIGSGSDTLTNFENLTGSKYNDILTGDSGNNTIDGGAGNDTLNGGAGIDTFVFKTTIGTSTTWTPNIDTITDFEVSEDIICLDNLVFKKLVDGTLTSDNFVSNNTGKAQDANDYIIYNKSNGSLYYDADGNGFGAAVVFATLANKPTDITYRGVLEIPCQSDKIYQRIDNGRTNRI